jgi:hypothetical protein
LLLSSFSQEALNALNKYPKVIFIKQVGSSNTVDLYSGGAWFEFGQDAGCPA